MQVYKHVTRNMEAHEQENKDFMKLIVKDYAVPYITQIPACLVFDCVDWILQQEEKDWIDYAYVEYMMQNVMTDKKEGRRQAIEKHAPRSEYTIKELKERIEQYFEDSYSVERLFTILAFLKRENILVTGINNETE